MLKFWFPAADVVADIALVALPVHLWKDSGLSRGRKILVLSAFSSSLLLTAITIPHSITLFKIHTPSSLIFAHVKVSTLLSWYAAAPPI